MENIKRKRDELRQLEKDIAKANEACRKTKLVAVELVAKKAKAKAELDKLIEELE